MIAIEPIVPFVAYKIAAVVRFTLIRALEDIWHCLFMLIPELATFHARIWPIVITIS